MNLLCLTFVLFCLIQFVVTKSQYEDWLKPISKKDLKKLNNLKDDEDPALYSGQFEGDMILSPEQIEILYGGNDDDPLRRNGIRNKTFRWPDKRIPYKIKDHAFVDSTLELIQLAIGEIEDVSCVKFIAYDPRKHKDYVLVTAEFRGCNSQVGRQGGEQTVNIGSPACYKLFVIVHELLHALGFLHQQAAPNRDDYIRVDFTNIHPARADNFQKYEIEDVTMFDTPYDYGSVMHYSAQAFALNKGTDTIIALKPLNGEVMGQRERLSKKDIQKLNSMYCETFWRDPGEETDEDIEYTEKDEDELQEDGEDSENEDDYSDDELDEDDYDDEDDDEDDVDYDGDWGREVIGGTSYEEGSSESLNKEVVNSSTNIVKNDLESSASPSAEASIYDTLAKLLDNVETLYNKVKSLLTI